MAITAAHSFLVHPAKLEEEKPKIGGTRVLSKDGKLWRMLDGLYGGAESECNIEIAFNPAGNGQQQNDCRDLVVAYAQNRGISLGRKLANRLQSYTTNRSGLGLMFLIVGSEDNGLTKVVISRFPADSGILAEEKGDSLSVEFLERVFMKSARSYKAVVYKDRSFDKGFWKGFAIDRQVETMPDYWIKEFLASDFLTTSASGTKRLAGVIRNALKSTSEVEVKSELVAAARLARGMAGKPISIARFMDQYHLSASARSVMEAACEKHLRGDQFLFDSAEFDRQLPLRSVGLDTGAFLTAPAPTFDDAFKRNELEDGRAQFVAEGRIVDDKLRKRE